MSVASLVFTTISVESSFTIMGRRRAGSFQDVVQKSARLRGRRLRNPRPFVIAPWCGREWYSVVMSSVQIRRLVWNGGVSPHFRL